MNIQIFKNASCYLTRPYYLLKNYERGDMRPDLIAGLTVAIVMLPQAIAFAMIAELPPQIGLYSAIVASIVGALWGASNHLHTGPTNTTSLLVLTILLPLAEPGSPEFLAIAGLMAIMVGIFRLALGMARMGIMVNFISDSVIIGFTAGAGVLIGANQLRHLLNLNIASTPSLLLTLKEIGLHIMETHMISLGVGLAAILLILLVRALKPKWPAPLIAMIIAGAVVGMFHLEQQGVKIIGELPRSLPPISKLKLDLAVIGELSTGALALGAIGLVEAIAISRSIASVSGQRLDSNQEFVGQGLANIACGLFSGYTVSGSFTRSGINYDAGARTPVASIFSGIFVLIFMLAFGPLAAYIPRTALAGVLIVTAYSMIDQVEIRRILQGTRGDRFIMVATFLATLFLPLQFAVLTGIMLSLAIYILRTSVPSVVPVLPAQNFRHFSHQPDKAHCPQLAIFDILGDLYFGAVNHVEETLRVHLDEHPDQRFLLLRLNSVHQCDISGIHTLENIVDYMRERGGDIFLMRIQPPVLKMMQSTGFIEKLGEDHCLRYEHAISFLYHRILDPAICVYECSQHVFLECQNLPKNAEHALGLSIKTEIPAGDVAGVSPLELWAELHIPSPPRIIDVREPREFKRKHIPQAESRPLSNLLADTEQIEINENIVFVCHGGRRSTRVTYFFAQQGYLSVRVLRGGLLAWEHAGLLEAVDSQSSL